MRNSTVEWRFLSVHRFQVITIDLRDAVGDRLFLSGSLRREGVRFIFSTAHPHTLDEIHSSRLSSTPDKLLN